MATCALCEKQEATHIANAAWVISRMNKEGRPDQSTEKFFRSKEDAKGGLHLCGDCIKPFLEGA